MSLVGDELAGSPVTDDLWVRRSLRKLERALLKCGMRLGRTTIRRVLLTAGIHAKSNVKRIAPKPHPDRDTQFRYLTAQRRLFTRRGEPVLSVDTKKKELIGLFYSRGRRWEKKATDVFMYDFPGDAVEKVVPYGVYDVRANDGYIFLGLSSDTPDFAVDGIVRWWVRVGARRYASARRLLILADGGGSNSSQSRRWKYRLQRDLVERFGLTVTVCHYPPGASKWNPIEHRLFSQISETWAGLPLLSSTIALEAIRATRTATGLRIRASLIRKYYAKGERVSADEWRSLNLRQHSTCPWWNYNLCPSKNGKLFADAP